MLTEQEWLSVATEPRSLVARLQGLDPPEERTDSEVVGERLPVVIAGSPDLPPVGSVQPGVVPDDRPGCGSLAAPGEKMRSTVTSRMRRAYHADSALAAEAELTALAAELDR